MKRKLFYIIALCLTFVSCRNLSDNHLDFQRNDEIFRQDTSLILSIISRIENSNYPDNDSALNLIQQALDLSCEHHFEIGTAEALFSKGNILYNHNLYNDAYNAYDEANTLAGKLENFLLKAKCLERMASVKLSLGDDHLSIKLYYEALPLFEQTNNKEGIAKVYNIIGLYKSGQKEYDSSEAYYLKAIKINEEINNQTGLVHNKGNLGYLFEKTGKLSEARDIYKELTDFLIKSGDSINLPVIYYNFSSLYQRMNLSDSAILNINKAIAISKKTYDTAMLSTLYGNLGELYLEQRQFDSAFRLLNLSVDCSKATGDYETQVQATELLLHLDTLAGEYRKAAGKFRQIIILKDSVYSKKLTNNLKSSELQYKVKKRDDLIEIQRLQITTTEKQKQVFMILFLFSVFTLFLIIVLIMFMVKNNEKRRRLIEDQLEIKNLQVENAIKTEEVSKLRISKIENEMRLKEREQMSDALALEQKNELLGLINNKINKAMEKDGVLTISELNGVVSAIKSQIKDSDDLFNQKFDQLHHIFFDKLKKSHPELTKSELKFCAYLKLRLTSNQIASLMHVTLEAIRKSRYRIRKKLGLERNTSLEDYISKF